jgi:hypothetical protein
VRQAGWRTGIRSTRCALKVASLAHISLPWVANAFWEILHRLRRVSVDWGMFRIARDSPLRKPPQPISEQQIVLLDGIRYSADMAGIAIDRLWEQLCFIDGAGWEAEQDVEPHHIAAAALDAWSIIDAVHRMSDLVENLPGLPNSPWRRVFRQRVADALALRDMWQHQVGEAPAIVQQRGQAWGALAWAQHRNGQHTGHWYLAVAGSEEPVAACWPDERNPSGRFPPHSAPAFREVNSP